MVNLLKLQDNLHGITYKIKIILNGIAEYCDEITDNWLPLEQCQCVNLGGLLFCFPHQNQIWNSYYRMYDPQIIYDSKKDTLESVET